MKHFHQIPCCLFRYQDAIPFNQVTQINRVNPGVKGHTTSGPHFRRPAAQRKAPATVQVHGSGICVTHSFQ